MVKRLLPTVLMGVGLFVAGRMSVIPEVNAPPIVSVFTVQPPLAMGSDVCSRLAHEIHGETCTTIIPGGR